MEEMTLDSCRRMYAAAREKLDVAKSLHNSGYYSDSVSRAYYAAFHAVSMLLFANGQSYSRHGQLIGAFNKKFVAPGELPKDLGKALGRLYDQRQVADYDVFDRADEKESAQGISDAESIIEAIRIFVEKTFHEHLV
jgi:Uncharacterized conserved protein related to C-terminal domain of eukaryotic chaperone, SACSIN